MAIEKEKAKELLKQIDEFIDVIVPKKYKMIKNKLIELIHKEFSELIEDKRPPVFYLIGRSGHGKSSLINALANENVADVGDVKPTTPGSYAYTIKFPDQHAEWKIVDSRGLFETTPPEGEPDCDTVEKVKQDIKKFKPDVILHVISMPEIRNLEHDLKVFSEILDVVKNDTGSDIPVIIILNKADTMGNPREWPPEKYTNKAELIYRSLEYMAKEILSVNYEYINSNQPYKGLLLKESNYFAIIPVCSLKEDVWNIDTLSEIIFNELPKNAILDFLQAQKRKNLLKKFSSSIIKSFSGIAFGVAAEPVPVADIAILTPLQFALIALIGGLSCKPISVDTAREYLVAAGLNLGSAFAFRNAARQIIKFIPALGDLVSGGIAAGGTYAIGKSAEAYFFDGKLIEPKNFWKIWEK